MPISPMFLLKQGEVCQESRRDDVEDHLNVNDLKSAYRVLKKLHSKSTSRVSAIRTADGCLVSDADGQMVRWIVQD